MSGDILAYISLAGAIFFGILAVTKRGLGRASVAFSFGPPAYPGSDRRRSRSGYVGRQRRTECSPYLRWI